MGKYYVTIQSHLWNDNKEFNDFKSAVEYAKEMEAYYYGILKYRHKSNANITITVSSNMKADEEYHIEIISKNNILTSTWYYNGERKEKRREVLDSKLNIGDSIKFKDGRTGIVEDYDDKFYYVRDSNTNLVKIKKVKDGTWALPFTKNQAQKLYDLIHTNKYDNQDKMKILYSLYGDDNLFDDLYDYNKETTVFKGNVVKRYVKNILNKYEENPEGFRIKLEPEAKIILEKIILE